METDAMNSSLSRSVDSAVRVQADNHDVIVTEENGWTAYLQDSSCANNGSFISSSPSLVSDAAWNGSDKNNNNNNVNHVRRLNFKNLKKGCNNHKRYSCGDDDLEDTASSPVNSPKVSSLKEMVEVNYRRLDDHVVAGNFLGKQSSSNNLSKVRGDEKNGKEFVESRKIDDDEYHVDLRKRGLCLVPMSALMNYLG
ncbi:Vascular-related protein 1 [Sesamum alatum]|uniref:Vascular-related protein 1 n=1 Tax=Sesamum alatum TaxID=300844 RepID=A0AAE1XZ07_9LAMI|nr:Vascular-related protein 1 [Sesamum alatum]